MIWLLARGWRRRGVTLVPRLSAYLVALLGDSLMCVVDSSWKQGYYGVWASVDDESSWTRQLTSAFLGCLSSWVPYGSRFLPLFFLCLLLSLCLFLFSTPTDEFRIAQTLNWAEV